MPQQRMNREEFFARLAPLDEELLKKALWNLYWRAAPVRERVEAEISPPPAARRPANKAAPLDPAKVLKEVRSFTELARSGAYIAGDRRVSSKERSGWRFTFGRLADDARRALAAQDSEPAEQAAWHDLLLDRLPDYDAGDRLDRLAIHPAFGGPELLLLRARRGRQTGAMNQARALAAEALETLPGHHELLAFAAEIDAELPERAKHVIASRQIP